MVVWLSRRDGGTTCCTNHTMELGNGNRHNHIYDCDIKSSFDEIPHKKLMKVSTKYIADGTTLNMIYCNRNYRITPLSLIPLLVKKNKNL